MATRLALLWGTTPRAILDNMPASQWVYFSELYKKEPFGGAAERYNAAIVASSVINMAGKTSKSTSKPSDFMP